MHFVGKSTILTLTSDRATGEAYTLGHHLTVDGTKRRLMIATLRYNDSLDGRPANPGLRSGLRRSSPELARTRFACRQAKHRTDGAIGLDEVE